MDINELMNNPHYERLVELAKTYELDMGIMNEMAMGVIYRLEALVTAGIEINETHVIAAIHSWTHERQAITARYTNDPEFRKEMQGRVYDQIKKDAE